MGGIVEVYHNYGKNLKLYDVNSLYPSVMLNPMPTGKPIFSTDKDLNNYFGIVFASINTQDFIGNKMNYPLLAYRTEDRIFNVLGTWSGWYFSEELKLAKSLGYQITVHYGYKFEKTESVFNNYVNKFYNIKAGLDLNNSMDRVTAKLLLNSLYGRLGMNQTLDYIEVHNSKSAQDILLKYQVKEQYSITEDLELLRYNKNLIPQFNDLHK